MVDFDKLRAKGGRPKAIDPQEIFRRLPKPPGINDLYTSQAQVLQGWFERRRERDIVVKLHTGGGKTLVGLLLGQSTLNETQEPVLYLTPTVQLVKQTIDKANAYGIPAVPYRSKQSLADEFLNAKAIMVATYSALFNGLSRFGLRGRGMPVVVGGVILDDAHVAFAVVRDQFTLKIEAADNERYQTLTSLFRRSFQEIDRLGTFDDVVGGADFSVLDVPYWAWNEQADAVRVALKSLSDGLVWPLIRDRLHLCHALISRHGLTITPILPLVDQFPTFAECPRRVYMSATISDDSEVIRTFDADPTLAEKPLTSRALAGVSERMILVPGLTPVRLDTRTVIDKLITWVASQKRGVVVLVPSNKAAEDWKSIATFAEGSEEVDRKVMELQSGGSFGPFVFASRYDGIDLPGDTCRLLVMAGLPKGTSDYELYRGSALYGGRSITRLLAQRIEQGIGRGARGSGDHCVVLMVGADLAGWIAKETNFGFLTSATRAQLDMGTKISEQVKDAKDLAQTIDRCLKRDSAWTQYHAETLAEALDQAPVDPARLGPAAVERKAINLWKDGFPEKAIERIDALVRDDSDLDPQTRGWLQQLAARIASHWGNKERAEDLQRQAFSNNRNLLRPRALPAYRPLVLAGKQEQAIVRRIGEYRLRRGFLQTFEDSVAYLQHNSSSNQFEEALKDLGVSIGFAAQRFDDNGEGPDVLWMLPDQTGLVIEAKSRKKDKKALTKEQHGQLLVAGEWFAKNYPGSAYIRVSVHAHNTATKAAVAGASHALTYERLGRIISDARSLLTALCESQLPMKDLVSECSRLLSSSMLRAEILAKSYLVPFAATE